jgi:hypothetical protein
MIGAKFSLQKNEYVTRAPEGLKDSKCKKDNLGALGIFYRPRKTQTPSISSLIRLFSARGCSWHRIVVQVPKVQKLVPLNV